MCGIHAILGKNVDEHILRTMLASTPHRGGDHENISLSGKAGLAINRLSINDIQAGHQPLISHDGTVQVVCNGEIYNAPAIRNNLQKSQFQTHSDAEVLLHLYDKNRTYLVDELDGMFAFVLYDHKTDQYLAARDPYGIKPLYFAQMDETVYFASEVKSLLSATIPLEHVHSLPPGHQLTGKASETLIPKPWYSLDRCRTRSIPSPTLLRELLDHSVKKCLLRDPGLRVGVFLSGGIDSSIITALAAQHCQDLIAFTVGMPGSPDLKAAQQVATYLGIELVTCEFSIPDVIAMIPQAIWHVESYNQSLVFEGLMTMILAKAAREVGVKIVLCGEGSDEIFAGYQAFRDLQDQSQVERTMRRAMAMIGNTECRRLDRGTMAHSVEARVPFLDRQVVEYAINLPIDALLKKTPDRVIEKYILREAAADLLPANIIWRDKAVFDEVSGILGAINELDQTVSDDEWTTAQQQFPEARFENKATAALFRIFQNHFGNTSFSTVYERFGYYPIDEGYPETTLSIT